MKAFGDFLSERLSGGGFSTEDSLTTALPLFRQTAEAHAAGHVAPLEGIGSLHVEGVSIFFEEGQRQPLRQNIAAVARVEAASRAAVEIVAEMRRTAEVDDEFETVQDLSIAEAGEAIERPVYLPGYRAWEHLVDHHDPLTDIFSLGLILASIACGLDFSRPEDLQAFVGRRKNLFALAGGVHPVLARVIVRMTELDRHRRAQDLPALIRTLEHYRDLDVDFELDLAQVPDYEERDARGKRTVVLTKLRERLFELSRRNRLLHFRSTMASVNLTQASVPLSFDIRNIRPDQILVWSDAFSKQLQNGRVSLNKYLNFAEALYLPGILDRIGAEARKDEAEFGFAQLRLVACFLHWTNLKESPVEQYDSPLVLLPVKLVKKKGIRDTYVLEVLSSEAEVNPVVRHLFQQLYGISLPETLDLEKTTLDAFFAELEAKVQASEPGISLSKIDRPRIALIHEKARRKLDHYFRRARLAGRGVRSFLGLEYSYDAANYHPLGIRLFAERVRPPSTRLREIIEERPRPRTFVVAPAETDVVEKERSFFALQEGGDENPYTWNFDLCNVTLANFHYRKMSLVRDYESLLENGAQCEAFDCVFSLTPREATRTLPEPAPLEDRYDVVPCDPTQATAIDEARCGRSYIIQGPPGTGKSQTITNLIADYVARGKRVLFVCEKRAAIDVVYARLRHCGLANLCSLIHDSQTDKKAFVMDLKGTYEAFLKSAEKKRRQGASRDAVLAELRRELGPLDRFDAAMRDVPPHAGISTRDLLDRCLANSARLPKLGPLERERLPAYAEFATHEHAIARFTERWRRISSGGVLGRHAFRLLDPAVTRREEPLESILSPIEAALPPLARIGEELSRSRIPREEWDSLARTAELARYAKLMRPLVRARQVRLLDPKSRQSQALATESRRLDRVRAELDAAREATVNWRTKLPPVELAAALVQAEALETSYLPWIKPAWWRMRRIMNTAYDFADHVVRPSWSQVLRNLKNEYEQVENLEAAKQAIVDRLGIDLDFNELHAAKGAIQAAVPGLPDWVRRIHAAILKADEPEAILSRIDAAGEQSEYAVAALSGVMTDFEDLSLAELQSHLQAIREQRERLPEFLACLGELSELPRPIASALRTLPWTAEEIAAAAADNSLHQVYVADPWLRDFDSEARKRHSEAIAATYGDWLSANAAAIQQAAREKFLEHVRISELPAAQLSAEEKEFKKRYSRGRRELEHEFGKTMRYKPIRDLVSGESGEVVRDLKPVWLMSPLSVSDALPLACGAFDVVLFDEASQITLEEAVPSIFRAGQVIVVGDEMQLPPTDFFSAKQRSEDEDEVSIEENGEAIQYDLDSNSFLNHSAKNLASTMLGWHYRSRSEALISFSNWAFYDGRLLTVPDERLPAAGLAPLQVRQPFDGGQAAEAVLARSVSFHRLEDGVYNNRRNTLEAEYIAQLVGALLKLRRSLSLGIVAFSEAQQDEIEGALDRLAQEDREFRDLYEAELEREEDGQYVGLLVKNLENIQGDERDVIILSICYGYNPDGKMLMNFGPINKSGGEKRLNVAFSRAKHHMAVVSSIQSTDITNDYNDGARCLKNYLRYAEAVSLGEMAAAERVLRSLTRWPSGDAEAARAPADVVADQLAEALTQRGFIVDRAVGQSHFRCDLALRRAGDVAYCLGILIDTAQYYDQSDLLERDVLRPKLLVNFGWRICAVLAKDWHADPQRVVERIVAMAQG